MVVLPFHAFLSTWYGTLIGPLWLWKSWKEIVLGVGSLLVLGWLIRHKQLGIVMRDWLVLLLCTSAGFVIIVTLGGEAELDAKLAGLAMDLRYIVIFALGLMVARFAPKLRTLWLRRTPRLLLIGGLVLATLGVLQVTIMPLNFLERFGYDKETTIAPYILIDDNERAPRAFATLRGPNDYGAYLILPLVVALAYLVKIRDKLLISLSLVAGLGASASRSAWLAALAAVATIAVAVKQVSVKRIVLIGSASIVLLLGLFVAAVSVPSVRLAIFHSSPGDSSLTEGSTDAHWGATMGGIDRVIDDPMGCGAGCAGPASYYDDTPRISENYYVQIAETYGVVGLALWVAIFTGVMVRLWKHDERLSAVLFASGVGLSAIGFWLHVWADDPISLTWWCLAGIVIGNLAMAKPGKKQYSGVSKS